MAKIIDYGERAVFCMNEIERNRDNAAIAIEYVRELLTIIETKDNCKSDIYCKLVSHFASCMYYNICTNYLREFLVDYSPKDDKIGALLYGSLADSCYDMYMKHYSLQDTERDFYFQSFLKYGELDIIYRGKESKDKKCRGMYNMAVAYHNEYLLTKNSNYRIKAQKYYESALPSKWIEFARKGLESLNNVQQDIENNRAN